jgi:hypothetical protein
MWVMSKILSCVRPSLYSWRYGVDFYLRAPVYTLEGMQFFYACHSLYSWVIGVEFYLCVPHFILLRIWSIIIIFCMCPSLYSWRYGVILFFVFALFYTHEDRRRFFWHSILYSWSDGVLLFIYVAACSLYSWSDGAFYLFICTPVYTHEAMEWYNFVFAPVYTLEGMEYYYYLFYLPQFILMRVWSIFINIFLAQSV